MHQQLLQLVVIIQERWIPEEKWRFVKSSRHLKRSDEKVSGRCAALDNAVRPQLACIHWHAIGMKYNAFYCRRALIKSASELVCCTVQLFHLFLNIIITFSETFSDLHMIIIVTRIKFNAIWPPPWTSICHWTAQWIKVHKLVFMSTGLSVCCELNHCLEF